MIILDEDLPQKDSTCGNVAGPTLRLPERAATRSISPLTLPDYETSQALANHNGVYKKYVRRRIDSRFWRATFYALIIYIFLSLVIVIPVLYAMKQKSRKEYTPAPPWHANLNMQPPSDPSSLDDTTGAIPTCNYWPINSIDSNGNVSASSYVSIAPTSQFSIRSNVSQAGPQRIWGHLEIGMNLNHSSQDADLSISVQASSSALMSATNVCFAWTSDACDLAIYVPSHMSSSETLHFNITLLFPHITSPSTVDKLATWLPTFTQSIGDLDKLWTFNTANIQGGSSTIDVGYLQANNLIVQTSSAEIKGTFYVNESLTLDTIDAPIDIVVTLVNDWTQQQPTYMALDTGNGKIDAQILLHAPRPLNKHAHTIFQTSMRTFNAPLNVSVKHDDDTPPANFYLSAQDNVGEVHVSLDNKFAGTFDLETKLASVYVKQTEINNILADPSGNGGNRGYDYDLYSAQRKFGWVGWGKRPDPRVSQGGVVLATTHSPVVLQLAGAGDLEP